MNTANPAIEWLNADFDEAQRCYKRWSRARTLDESWTGPSAIRPIIQLRTLLDGGKSMTVTQVDYKDPERRWL
jgi:hypothetical protein